MARLGPAVEKHRDHVVLHLHTLEKQARPGNIRGYLAVQFFDNRALCPATAILDYSTRVSVLRGDQKSFFVGLTRPHRAGP